MSKPPRYACKGGPLDGQLINAKWDGDQPNPTMVYRQFHGRYELRRDAQGDGLHVYVWAEP